MSFIINMLQISAVCVCVCLSSPSLTHARTHTHTQKQSLRLMWSPLVSEPALGHLCAARVLEVNTGMSSWGRTSDPQEAVPCLTYEGVWAPEVPTRPSPAL